ncbi:MAG: T9SS type A sorting domain-containing protein [Flavobacteriales bacterium]|nr:T9SS type A sorting domain-containing protein [Flavobacteriales bacterium]
MKKTVLFGAFLGISVLVTAQSRTFQTARAAKADGHVGSGAFSEFAQAPSQGSARGTTFWSEDFSGGAIPAGWTNTDTGTPSGTPNVTFVWSNDPAAVAPAALGYAPSANFNAPGANNGYLWANSDRGLPAAPATNHLTQLTTTAIDCSGQPTVQLTFDGLIGVFDLDAADFVKVRVSTDLSNWTDYQPFPCLITGAAAPPCSRWSANPEQVILDISATAANQSVVYLQFQWEGGWEYFWAIDNIALSQLPDYERRLANVFMTHIDGGYEFHRIPQNEFGSTITVGGEATNQGANPQTNLTITATINPGGLTASQNFAAVAPGETASMSQTINIGALAEGEYTTVYTITSNEDASESDPSNDTYTRKFKVDNLVYSLDGKGVHPAGIENLTSMGSNSFLDAADGLEIMTYYQLRVSTTVYAVRAEITSATVPGGAVIVSIHDTLPVFNDNMNQPIAQSDVVTVTAADVTNGYITGVFDNPVVLAPNGYYASIRLLSNNNANDIRVFDDVTVAQPNIASLIYIPNDVVYSNGNASAVRLVLDPTIGIQENRELMGVGMYPNPTNGVLNFTTVLSGNHAIEVMDILGNVVLTQRLNGNGIIDLTGMAVGVYMVRVEHAQGSMVQRIALN